MTTKKWIIPTEGYVRHLYVLEATGMVLVELHPARNSIMTHGGHTDEQIVWDIEWPLGGRLASVYGLSKAKVYVEDYYARNTSNTPL